MPKIVTFKPIKPQKFLDTVFKTEIRAALKATGARMNTDFGRTTRTWRHQPSFTAQFSETLTVMKFDVMTGDQIYAWVNDGTSGPYWIYPRRANGWLSYRRFFRAKTSYRAITSRAGGKYGDYISRSYVSHPGIAAREFDIAIAEKTEPILVQKIGRALETARIRCRHAI